MDHIANQILNNPGAMNKMIAAWTPTLPNSPAIDDKQVAYFMLVRFTPEELSNSSWTPRGTFQ
jgi:hypothetical protein